MIFNVGCRLWRASMECAASAVLFWNGILWSAQPRLRCFFMECGGMTPQAQPRLRTPKSGIMSPHSKSGIVPPHSINE